MAVVKMQKLQVVIHKDNFEKVLFELQKFGQFEIVEGSKEYLEELLLTRDEEINHEIDLNLAEISFALKMLMPLENKRKSFAEKIIGKSIFGKEDDVLAAKFFDFKLIVKQVADIEENLNKNKVKLEKIIEEKKMLIEWKNLNFPGSVDRDTLHAEMRLGEISTKDFKDFSERFSILPYVHLHVVSENPNHTFFLAVYHKETKEEATKLFEIYRFNETVFSKTEQTPKEQINIFKNLEKEIQDEINKLKKDMEHLATNINILKFSYDYYLWEKEKVNAREFSHSTEKTLVIDGWIPAKEYKNLESSLNTITNNFNIDKINPQENENPPVQLKNSKLFEPFETVTRIFGLPMHFEIDPTPYLAPFFVIFFGFCLTDAGYGIILTVATILILKYLPLDKDTQKMIRLLFWGGLSTIIMGVLFGGWFGLTVETAPSFLVSDGKFIFQIFDPLNDLTSKIMPLAYGLGFLQLWFGVVLSGATKVKNGHLSEAIQTSFLLAVLLIVVVVMGLSSVLGLSEQVVGILKNVFYVLLIMSIWGFGYGSSFFARPFLGAINLMNEGMSWLSNVLSYSRLFALGLATGIIAMVFNQVAVTIGGMMNPIIGFFVMLIIILFGHVLNIALNLLGAFIHSARLQFVEFFGKFAEFGGKAFKPLSRNSEYLFIKD